MKVRTEWKGLVPAIERAGHEAVLELPRCATGYCKSHGRESCIMRVKGSTTCPNFTYNGNIE